MREMNTSGLVDYVPPISNVSPEMKSGSVDRRYRYYTIECRQPFNWHIVFRMLRFCIFRNPITHLRSTTHTQTVTLYDPRDYYYYYLN